MNCWSFFSEAPRKECSTMFTLPLKAAGVRRAELATLAAVRLGFYTQAKELWGFMAARTIDEVLEQLDEIVDLAHREKSRLGYFAALYRNVTSKVNEGILAG